MIDDEDIVVSWKHLIESMECYTNVQGKELYPLKNKKQWLEYNRLCLEQVLYSSQDERYSPNYQLTETEEKQLLDQWEVFKKTLRKDNTSLSLYFEESCNCYKLIPCYNEGIKPILEDKGEKYDKD